MAIDVKKLTPMQLEFEVMVNRYLYYVLADTVISDYEYDIIEREARSVLPESSPVHGVGSSLPTSYSDNIIVEAEKRVKQSDEAKEAIAQDLRRKYPDEFK